MNAPKSLDFVSPFRPVVSVVFIFVLAAMLLLNVAGCQSGERHARMTTTSKLTGADDFLQPIAVALHPDGGILVTDSGRNRIVWLDDAGKRRAVWDGGARGFRRPLGIDVSPDGGVYVADALNDRIVVLDKTGQVLQEWSDLPNADRIVAPSDVAVASSGDVFVVEFNGARVLHLDRTGKLLNKWGTQGHGPDELYFPTGIKVAPDGNLWVTDAYNHRLKIYTPEGKRLAIIGTEGSAPGQFKTSGGVTFDGGGCAWAADFENSRLQRLGAVSDFEALNAGATTKPSNAKDSVTLIWPAKPSTDVLLHPTSLRYDPRSNIFHVVDFGHNRVIRLTPAALASGKSKP